MADKVNYNDPTPNKFPNDYDDSKVDSRVKLRSKSLAHKEMGKDVREALIQGVEISSVVAGEAKDIASDTASRQDDVDQAQKEFEERYNEQIAGNTDLDEVIDARKPNSKPSYTTLGERLNDMPSNEDLELLLGDDNNDVDGGIPDYEIQILTEVLLGIDTTKFNLGWGTDYHYDTASDYNPHNGDYTSSEVAKMWNSGLRKALNITSLSTKLDAIVFGGDNVDQPSTGTGGRPIMLKHNQDFASTVLSSSSAPTFLLKGNHDCNYNSNRLPETVILDAELAPIYRQDVCLFGENRLNASNYFYKDFEDKKVRLIGLDMYDLPETVNSDGTMQFNRFNTSGLQQAQLDWLANDALLTTPNDYVVLITGHSAPDGTMYSGRANHNHTVLKTILEAFVTGTTTTIVGTDTAVPVTVECKFANSGHLAGFLFGHWHKDESITVNGVNYIETRCSLIAGDDVIGAERMAMFGEPGEDAFDIATIDTAAKTLMLKRVGAGSDDEQYSIRTFDY